MRSPQICAALILFTPGIAFAQDPAPQAGSPTTSSEPVVRDGPAASGNIESDVKAASQQAGQNMFGGRVDGTSQIVLSTGFPHAVAASFRFNMGDFELAPHLYFDYGNPFGANIDLGAGTGIGGRVQVFEEDAWAIAVRFDVTFDGRFHPNRTVRANLNLGDPGVRVTYNVQDLFDINFGMDILPQLGFTTGGGTSFSLAVPFAFGVEGNIAPGIQIGFTGRGGPSFGAGNGVAPVATPGGWGLAGPYVEALVHVGFSLGNVKKALN